MEQVLYFVYFEGFDGGWGAEFFLLGVFDTEDKANVAIDKLGDKLSNPEDRIVKKEVVLNKVYDDIEHDYFRGYTNEMYIGGYIE